MVPSLSGGSNPPCTLGCFSENSQCQNVIFRIFIGLLFIEIVEVRLLAVLSTDYISLTSLYKINFISWWR